MNMRTFLSLLAVGLLALPASASEVGLLLDQQTGQSVDAPNLRTQINAVNPKGFGLRGALTLTNLEVAVLSIAATYHPKAQSDLQITYEPWPLDPSKAGSEYLALGAQLDWQFLVNIHCGLDLRRETISNEVVTVLNQRDFIIQSAGETTFTRPWVSAGLGYTFAMPVVSPFIRLEAAWTLKNYSADGKGVNMDDVRRAMAPTSQIALYGGIRF